MDDRGDLCAEPRGVKQVEFESCLVDGKPFFRMEFDGCKLLVAPKCPHKGAPMSEATVVGHYLVCRRHGATFDIRTGGWVRGPKCADLFVQQEENAGADSSVPASGVPCGNSGV